MKTLIIAVLAAGLMAQAQTSTTSVSNQQSGESSAKIQDLQKKDEQMKDIDQEITNAKLRAEMGSKSKWSLRSTVTYNGGTVQRAFHEKRPNITSGPNNDARANMTADLAVKYRTTDSTSLNAGVGVKMVTPFHRTIEGLTNSNMDSAPAKKKKQSSVSNPYLEFNHGGKLGAFQNFAQISGSYASEDYDQNVIGLTGSIGVSDQLIYELGNSSLGVAATIYQNLYKDSADTYINPKGEVETREDMGFYAVPFYEYAFNDRYNFRTVFNWCNFSKAHGSDNFEQQVIQQSMGLGISVTRDVFIYPNVQFIPQDIRADRTNLAVSANINLF